jgi:hypothetical protein
VGAKIGDRCNGPSCCHVLRIPAPPLADFLDIEELFMAIVAIAMTADQYDDKVSQMASGQRVQGFAGLSASRP